MKGPFKFFGVNFYAFFATPFRTSNKSAKPGVIFIISKFIFYLIMFTNEKSLMMSKLKFSTFTSNNLKEF